MDDPERYRIEYWEHDPPTSGRYYTGDSAYFDEDGNIWFCGRADEVIKISGHRIGTIEVENAIVYIQLLQKQVFAVFQMN